MLHWAQRKSIFPSYRSIPIQHRLTIKLRIQCALCVLWCAPSNVHCLYAEIKRRFGRRPRQNELKRFRWTCLLIYFFLVAVNWIVFGEHALAVSFFVIVYGIARYFIRSVRIQVDTLLAHRHLATHKNIQSPWILKALRMTFAEFTFFRWMFLYFFAFYRVASVTYYFTRRSLHSTFILAQKLLLFITVGWSVVIFFLVPCFRFSERTIEADRRKEENEMMCELRMGFSKAHELFYYCFVKIYGY